MKTTKIFCDVDPSGVDPSGVGTPRHCILMMDGRKAGFIEYSLHGKIAIVTHTEMDRQYEGRGLGSALARQMLQLVCDEGWQVVPVCGFFAHYLRTHPEYASAVTPASRHIFDI